MNTVATVATRYASSWQKPVNYGTGSKKSVFIKTVDGRMEIMGNARYVKRKEEKGSYILEWVVVDRWIPEGNQGYTTVPMRMGQQWTYDRKTAIQFADAWLKAHPLDAPMPGSQKAQ